MEDLSSPFGYGGRRHAMFASYRLQNYCATCRSKASEHFAIKPTTVATQRTARAMEPTNGTDIALFRLESLHPCGRDAGERFVEHYPVDIGVIPATFSP